MRQVKMIGLLLLGVLLVAGCGGRLGSGPQLVDEVPYIPTVAVLPSVTPVPPTSTATSTPTPVPPTPNLAATELVLVTPTLPPSRTPSLTWTPSSTPTHTATPLPTFPPTLTPVPTIVPPVVVQPTVQPVVQPGSIPSSGVNALPGIVDASGACLYPWFFVAVAAAGCPVNQAVTSASAYLEFTSGRMFWIGSERMIYVLYDDQNQPRWERFADTWVDSMPERDPNIIGPVGLWQQPRRGFGHVWRNNPNVRGRLSWALHEWETAYQATIQQMGVEGGGAVYISDPTGRIFELKVDQSSWTTYQP